MPDDTTVIVYDDTFGALASRVAWTLQYIGHGDVTLLDVTYSKWKELGLETDTKKPNIKPCKTFTESKTRYYSYC